MSLLLNSNSLGKTCQIMYFKLNNAIYHRLKNRNDWLYVVKDNHIVVTCDYDTYTKSLELNGTGILHIKNNCGFSYL